MNDHHGEQEQQRGQYANVHHMVRQQNKMGQDFNDLGKNKAHAKLPQKRKAVLVYEE